MKKSQISFEFVVLFVFVLFIFLVLASLFPSMVDRATSTKGLAENLAQDIKVKVITASLSETDFESKMALPKRINNIDILVNITGGTDNILVISNGINNESLARAFLPKIDGRVSGNINQYNLTIRKINNVLSIQRE